MPTGTSARLSGVGGAWLALTHYPSQARQPRHWHARDQLSFLVAGALNERLDGRDFDVAGGSVGYKPAGAWHEDRWGPAGALFFSINMPPGSLNGRLRVGQAGWTKLAPAFPLAALIRSCFATGSADERIDFIKDALADAGPAPRRPSTPPAWLRRAREALTDAPELSIDAVAAMAGVDRSHLSRSFRQHYGLAPSVHRRRVRTAQAIGAIIGSRHALGLVAHDAGFSDQAHMTRTLQAAVGFPPSGLRTLLRRDITSVQDGARCGR